MATFPYTSPYDLEEFTMIAGNSKEIVFNVYNSASSLVDLSGATITWFLSRIGDSNAIVTKSGVFSGSPIGQFTVNLTPSDTVTLQGKYVHQYRLVDSSGSTFRPSQGIINLSRAIV